METNPTSDPQLQASQSSGYYVVECMPPTQSPDPRCRLEAALAKVATFIRREPTVPADPQHPENPWPDALREDAAIQLPPKHCAFQGCCFNCSNDTELFLHVEQCHHDILKLNLALTLL